MTGDCHARIRGSRELKRSRRPDLCPVCRSSLLSAACGARPPWRLHDQHQRSGVHEFRVFGGGRWTAAEYRSASEAGLANAGAPGATARRERSGQARPLVVVQRDTVPTRGLRFTEQTLGRRPGAPHRTLIDSTAHTPWGDSGRARRGRAGGATCGFSQAPATSIATSEGTSALREERVSSWRLLGACSRGTQDALLAQVGVPPDCSDRDSFSRWKSPRIQRRAFAGKASGSGG